MFSPSWIPLVDKILKWKGFVSGCYYFLAHMRYADKKLTATFAKYTPISIEDLRDGAFDLDWFKSCYKQLGKERFAIYMMLLNISLKEMLIHVLENTLTLLTVYSPLMKSKHK